MKFTWTSQLSALSFTDRKYFMLILLLPSRKEKELIQFLLCSTTCPLVQSQVMMDLELGEWMGIVFILWAAESWLGNPAGGSAGKKRFYLTLCRKKYMALSFLDIGKEKKKMFSKYWVWGLSFTELGLCFLVCFIQIKCLLFWLGGGRRESEPPGLKKGADTGSLGPRSVVWNWSHTIGNLLDRRKEQLSSKTETFPHGNILACILVEVTTVIVMRIAERLNTEWL